MRRARAFLLWIPPLLWSLLILSLSGGGGSSATTRAWILGTTRAVGLELDELQVDLLDFALRKTAHVVVYAILGFLNFRAWRQGRAGWRLEWAIAAFLLAGAVAVCDEWRQSFVSSRSGTVSDVIVDLAGAALAQLIWRNRSERRDATADEDDHSKPAPVRDAR